jgi:hypothetical protein
MSTYEAGLAVPVSDPTARFSVSSERRLLSLNVFRGFTLLEMTLVNNQPDGNPVFAQNLHQALRRNTERSGVESRSITPCGRTKNLPVLPSPFPFSWCTTFIRGTTPTVRLITKRVQVLAAGLYPPPGAFVG